VRDQDHANAIDLALRLGRPYRTTAHDAGPTGASVSLVDTTGDGETPLRKPNMDLLSQLVRREQRSGHDGRGLFRSNSQAAKHRMCT
jgi:hypothetical protein